VPVPARSLKALLVHQEQQGISLANPAHNKNSKIRLPLISQQLTSVLLILNNANKKKLLYEIP